MRHAYLCAAAFAALALLALGAESRAEPVAAPVPRLDPQNLIADDIQAEALAAHRRHAAQAAFRGSELVIIDYRKASNEPRLFILDLATGAVEAHYVAHGRGSDPGHTQVAMRFGDAPTSGMSSVGAFRGLERYQSSENGPALRLAGLDWTNANAFDRLIVFHTASYFNPAERRFGRSCGCFVVTRQAMERIYGVLADGGFLYAGPAGLHDRNASAVRDCNPRCGGNCSEPLIASVKPPVGRPVTVAKSDTMPSEPRPKALPARPVHSVALAQAEPVPIRPRPKPFLPPEHRRVVTGIPTPLAKPDLPDRSSGAMASADRTPVPSAKPDLRPMLDELAATSGELKIPNPGPDETPVPAQKPAGLRQVAVLEP
jgi:hypothetical protein